MSAKYIHDVSFNDITSFELSASLGLLDGVQVLSKFGLNPDADAGVQVDVGR